MVNPTRGSGNKPGGKKPNSAAAKAEQERLAKLEQQRKDLREDYAYVLGLIATDTTGSLQPWFNKLYEQLQSDTSPNLEATKIWIEQSWSQTEWAKERNKRQQEAAIMGARPELAQDWAQVLEDLKREAGTYARQLGIQVDENQLTNLASRLRADGLRWNTDANEIRFRMRDLLRETIARPDADLMGTVGDFETQLAQWARRNGIEISRGLLAPYLERLTLGEQTLDDVKADLRRMYLVGAFPSWADKIEEGYDPYDLGAPYRNKIASLLELDENSIGFDDPLMLKAMGGMPLWDLAKEVRNDPRWQYTDNAYETYTSTAVDLLRMFGFR